MSMRLAVASMAVVLLVAAAASTAAVVRLLTNASEAAAIRTASAHAIQTAQDLELNLLRLNRLRLRDGGDREADAAQDRAIESALTVDLAEEARLSRTNTERRLADATTDAAHAYLALPTPSPLSERRLADALASVGQLVSYDAAAAEAGEAQVSGRYRAAADFASAASLLLIVGVAVTLVSLQRFAVRPLTELRGCIESFAAGHDSVRAAAAGPVETRAIAAAFNTMADRLVEHRARERTFIAGVAHDLRTPLNALRLAADLASRDETWSDTARAQRVALVVARQVSALERMTGDLLDDTMLLAGRLQMDTRLCDLRQVVETVLDMYRAQPLMHALEFEGAPTAVWVLADAGRLQQVVTNLVSNALKYSPPESPVRVQVRAEPDRARIDVIDGGPGIAPADRDRIFDAFQRGRHHAGSTPGAGLGLALARRIVEAHNGSIALDGSIPGRTVFTVRLPLASV